MVSWHGFIFWSTQRFWNNLRNFAYINRSVFEIVFILLYSIEQAALILLSFLIKDLNLLKLIVAFFAVIVLTTFALHKLLMESRIKRLEGDLAELIKVNTDLYNNFKHLLERYNEVVRNYNSLFNKPPKGLKTHKGKKGMEDR